MSNLLRNLSTVCRQKKDFVGIFWQLGEHIMDHNGHNSTQNKGSAFKEVDPEDFEKRNDIGKVLRGMQRFIPLIAVSTLLFGFIGGIYTWHNLTTYTATAYLLYHDKVIEKSDNFDFNVSELTLPTAMELILNPAHLEAIKSVLGLDISSGDLANNLEVPAPKNKSNVIQVVAVGDNPNLAVDIANTLARISVRSATDYLQSQFTKSLNTYKKEIDDVKLELAKENQEIEKFKQKNQYLEMGADYSMIIKDMVDAKEQLEKAKVEYDSLLVQYENLKRGIGNLPENMVASIEGGQTSVMTQIMQLKGQLSDAKARYTENNPKVLRLQEQLNDLMGSAPKAEGSEESVEADLNDKIKSNVDLMRMQATVRAAQKRKEYLEDRLSEIEKSAKDVPAEQMKLSKLLHEKEVTQARLQWLQNNYNQILLKLNNPKGNLELYLSAEEAKPKNDKLLTYLMPFIGLIFGFLTGLSVGFILEMLDNKLRTKKQIEIFYNIPLFSMIPEIKRLKHRNADKKLIYFTRQLYDKILNYKKKIDENRGDEKNGSIAIGFLSCGNGDGKSVIVRSLAKYCGMIEKSVALLSLDPKEGRSEMQQKNGADLFSFLSGEGDMEVLIKGESPLIIDIGYADSSLNEKVKSPRLPELIEELKRRYEFLFIDIPALYEEEFATYVAGLCDANIMVVNSSKNSKEEVDGALEELQGFDIIPAGFVLNNISKLYLDSEKLLREMKIANKI